MKRVLCSIGLMFLLTTAHAGWGEVSGPRMVWAEGDGSQQIGVRGADGEMLVGVEVGGESAIQVGDNGSWHIPLSALAALRDALDSSAVADAPRLSTWIEGRMGPYADTPASLVPVHHFAVLADDGGSYTEWCGEYRQNGWCKGDCRSPCGIGKDKCCDCVCYQAERGIMLR